MTRVVPLTLLLAVAGCMVSNPDYDPELAALPDPGEERDLLQLPPRDLAVDHDRPDLTPPPDLYLTCRKLYVGELCKTDDDCCGVPGACRPNPAGFVQCCSGVGGRCGASGNARVCCDGLMCRVSADFAGHEVCLPPL